MSILTRLPLPASFGNEATKYNELLYKGTTRTSTGNLTYTSTTSSTTYSTLTSYSGVYANRGEEGLLDLLGIEVLEDYIIDGNWVTSVETTVGNTTTLNTTDKTSTVNAINEVNTKAEDATNYTSPTSVVAQLINITTLSTESIIKLKISTTVTGGEITISRNGATAKPLLNVDGSAVIELSNETKFFEVVEETVNFTLLPKGGVKEFFGDGSDGTIPDLNTVTTAPNGGTVANLWDMNTGTVFTTGTLSSASDQVVFSIDFGSPQNIIGSGGVFLPRLYNASISTGVARTLAFQYSDDAVIWGELNNTTLSTTPTSPNVGGHTSPHRYWRLLLKSGGSNCTVSIQGMVLNDNGITDTQTTKIWRIIEPSTLNGGAVIKQYTQYTLPVGYEHTVQNPCQGLVIYSQGNAVVNGVIDMSQKAGLAPNGNPIPMPIVPSYIRTAKTSSLLHFDNNITDSNGRTWTNNGSATFDATNKKFGTHAISFNGSSQWLDTPASDGFSFGNDDFTIDFWMRSTDFSGGNRSILSSRGASDNYNRFSLETLTTGKITFNASDALGNTLVSTSSSSILSINTFYHIVLTKHNKFLKLYVNGVLDTSIYFDTPLRMTNKLVIGRLGDVATQYFAGQIDEFRIVKGKAMYTANFTPPVSAYTYEATINDEVEAFKEMYQLTTILQTLRGGYGGNGGYGGGYSGSTGRQTSVGIGGAGRQNLGGFGGGGSGGGYSGTWSLSGGVGGSILFAELGGGVLTGGMPLNSNNSAFTVNGINGSGAFAPVINSGSGYTINSGKCNGAGGGGCGPMTSGSAGDGEYAGGFVLFICKGSFMNSGTIKSNGGKGGNGWSVAGISNSGGGGGGGGAGGGVISILHKGTYANTGTLQANGGVGGSAGAGVSVGEAGGSGTSGSVGTINIQQL